MFKKTFLVVACLASASCGAYEYDLVVIGGGSAGLTAATTAAKLSKKVLLIEKEKIGGGRIWAGDLPFKMLFHKTELFGKAQRLFSSDKALDSTDIHCWFQEIQQAQKTIYEMLLRKLALQTIDVMKGKPSFVDKHTIRIENKQVSSHFFIIATGSYEVLSSIENVENVDYLTRENFFSQKSLPKSMIIVGGGLLGVEMASCLSRLGVEVDIVMRHGMLLPTYDFEIVELIMESLFAQGVRVHLATHAAQVNQDKDGTVHLTCHNRIGQEYTIAADALFLALGNRPNVDSINLDDINIRYSQKGIAVKSSMQTSVDTIYACGDVVGVVILARIAHYHAKLAVYNMFCADRGPYQSANYTHITKVVSTIPQFATAGLTEQEARKFYGNNLDIYRVDYQEIDKACIEHNYFGKAKFICDKNGALVGAHIFGQEAGALIDSITIGSTLSDLFLKEVFKIRATPNYHDIIEKVSHLAYVALPQEKTLLQRLLGKSLRESVKTVLGYIESVCTL